MWIKEKNRNKKFHATCGQSLLSKWLEVECGLCVKPDIIRAKPPIADRCKKCQKMTRPDCDRCPKCGSHRIYTVDDDMRWYCASCRHTWYC